MERIYKEKERNKLIIETELPLNGQETGNFREKMLQNNHIDGFLEFRINVTDNEKRYEFDTEGMETLDSFCERTSFDNKRIILLLKGIAGILTNGEKYMLDEMDYILAPEFIYLKRDGQPQVAYFSGYSRPFRSQLGNLAEYLMNRTDYHDRDGVLTIYTVYMKTREEGFGVRELISFLNDGEKYVKPEIETMDTLCIPQSGFKAIEPGFGESPLFGEDSLRETENKLYAVEKKEKKELIPGRRKETLIMTGSAIAALLLIIVAYKFKLISDKNGKIDIVKGSALLLAVAGAYIYLNKNRILKKEKQGKLKPEKEETIVPRISEAEDEATEFLFDLDVLKSREEEYSLVSESWPEIKIHSFPFYIGKDPKQTDFFLNAPGVSRCHLKFEKISGEIVVSDLNSTNGSFLNGKRLVPDKPVKIFKGDSIRIGRCEYRFEKIS